MVRRTRKVPVMDFEYEIAALSHGQAREIFQGGGDYVAQNYQMAAVCLNNIDGGARTGDDVRDMDYPDAEAIIVACMDTQRTTEQTKGEAPAGKDTAA